MTAPFLRAYALLLIKTCHRRNAFAMGGMAAQIPIRNDPAANEAALGKVRADKVREATDGCDGTWVAHPGLVAFAREVFDRHMPAPNQVHRLVPEDLARVRALLGEAGWESGRCEEAAGLFERITTSDEFVEFLTLPAYERLTRAPREPAAA